MSRQISGTSTCSSFKHTVKAINSVGRVAPLHGASRGFESPIAYQKGYCMATHKKLTTDYSNGRMEELVVKASNVVSIKKDIAVKSSVEIVKCPLKKDTKRK